MLNNIFDKILYINLEHRKDRRKEIEKLEKKLSSKFERFNAFYDDIDKSLIKKTHNCFLSHLECIKMCIPYEISLILEDDVIFTDDFIEDIEIIIEKFKKSDGEVLYFHSKSVKNKRAGIIPIKHAPHYTHCYAIKKPEKLYNILKDKYDNKNIKRPFQIDCNGFRFLNNIKFYNTTKFYAYQKEGFSDILNKNRDNKDSKVIL